MAEAETPVEILRKTRARKVTVEAPIETPAPVEIPGKRALKQSHPLNLRHPPNCRPPKAPNLRGKRALGKPLRNPRFPKPPNPRLRRIALSGWWSRVARATLRRKNRKNSPTLVKKQTRAKDKIQEESSEEEKHEEQYAKAEGRCSRASPTRNRPGQSGGAAGVHTKPN